MLEIGTLVDGKYKILRVVGKGGMSVVYQAVNEKANKIWAIKEVRKDGTQNFEVVKQNLVAETDMLKRFNHPNLPSIIDVIDTEDSFLIVMDYIEGNSLSKALETSGAQSQEDVIEWSKQLCDVLGYLHSRKPPIIYRDMKPANVMLKPDGNVSLIDFGTAREFKSSSVEDTTCLGTQGYAAPEQYGGHGQTDARTDIYCLGATMYHLVTGHNPSTPPYEMYPIRQWNPMLSSGLEEIIIKCTQRNPNDRYQNCAELLYALDHFQDLDIENQKVQTFKWKTFLTSLIICMVLFVAAIGLKIGASSATSHTYNSLLDSAADRASSNVDDAVSLYKEAIAVEPANIEAYRSILNLYLSDDNLSEAEYNDINLTLKSVSDAEGNTVDTQRILSSSNKEEYARLCYDVARYVFFCYDSDKKDFKVGAEKSQNWFNKAAAATTDENLQNDITSYLSFAESCIRNEAIDATGETAIDYREVFTNLQYLIDNIDPTANIVYTLKSYRFIAKQLGDNAFRYSSAFGGDDTEYLKLLNKMKSNLLLVEQNDVYLNTSKYITVMQDANQFIDEAIANGFGKKKSVSEGVGG